MPPCVLFGCLLFVSLFVCLLVFVYLCLFACLSVDQMIHWRTSSSDERYLRFLGSSRNGFKTVMAQHGHAQTPPTLRHGKAKPGRKVEALTPRKQRGQLDSYPACSFHRKGATVLQAEIADTQISCQSEAPQTHCA